MWLHVQCAEYCVWHFVVVVGSRLKPALVRLRRRPHSGVEVPARPSVHRPVTEGYCVVATRGGELPEVNHPSVTT